MKKIFSLMMIGAMCSVGFTGCGDKKTSEKKVETTDKKMDGSKVETEKTETKTETPPTK